MLYQLSYRLQAACAVSARPDRVAIVFRAPEPALSVERRGPAVARRYRRGGSYACRQRKSSGSTARSCGAASRGRNPRFRPANSTVIPALAPTAARHMTGIAADRGPLTDGDRP